MSESIFVDWESIEWKCPACNSITNSLGVDFSSSRAVSLHIAGKIRTGDSTHKLWAIKMVGDIIQDLLYESINTLAAEIEPIVIEAIQISTRELDELITSKVEEREANEEPNVLAYRYLRNIELPLYNCVRQTLIDGYGANEDEWWVQGIPYGIRRGCVERRELSTHRKEPYDYIYFIDLKTIIEKNRTLFTHHLHAVSRQANRHKEFLDDIAKCNDIRNRVMHTMHEVSNEDLIFLKQFCELVRHFSGEH